MSTPGAACQMQSLHRDGSASAQNREQQGPPGEAASATTPTTPAAGMLGASQPVWSTASECYPVGHLVLLLLMLLVGAFVRRWRAHRLPRHNVAEQRQTAPLSGEHSGEMKKKKSE